MGVLHMIRRACLLACLLCPTVAFASDWQRLPGSPASPSGPTLDIDMQSIRALNDQQGRLVQAWVRLGYPGSAPSKELWRFDCARELTITLSRIKGEKSAPADFEYNPVAPDTFGEAIMRIVCQ